MQLLHLDDVYEQIHRSPFSTQELVDHAVQLCPEYLSANGPMAARAFLNSLPEDERRIFAADALVSTGHSLNQGVGIPHITKSY